MPPKTMITDVADTAFWVAHYRALESKRPDALFNDSLAIKLVGEKGKKIAESMKTSRFVNWHVVIRTWIIDKIIKDAVVEGVDTVLNLGAGLDTRPYRLDLPASLKWIEVDQDSIMDFKEQKLRDENPKCQLIRYKLDLSKISERRKLFTQINSESKKVLVLTEGVVPYLTEDLVAEIAKDLKSQDHFYYWILEYYSPMAAKNMQRRGLSAQMKNAPFKFFPADWYGFFEKLGWKVSQIKYLHVESKNLGRKAPMPYVWPMLSAILKIISPNKLNKITEGLAKSIGYAVLSPKN